MTFGRNVIQSAWGRMCEREGWPRSGRRALQEPDKKSVWRTLWLLNLLHVPGQSEDVLIQQISTLVIFTHLPFVCEQPPQWNPVSILVKAASAHFSLQGSVSQTFNDCQKPWKKQVERAFFFFSLVVAAKSFTFKLEGRVEVFKQLFSFAVRIFKQSHSSIMVHNPQ